MMSAIPHRPHQMPPSHNIAPPFSPLLLHRRSRGTTGGRRLEPPPYPPPPPCRRVSLPLRVHRPRQAPPPLRWRPPALPDSNQVATNHVKGYTAQVTTFKCGGFSIGFVTNHSILDGRSAAEMFENLASICRGEGVRTHVLNIDRSCIKARDSPQIKYRHSEYTKHADASSFTSPGQATPPSLSLRPSENHSYRLFTFSHGMIKTLKEKAVTKCSTFEAIVAHLWRARAKAVFDDPCELSSVLFAVDVRYKMTPPLPHGFIGNAVITASASARVVDLDEKPFSYCVEMVKGAIEKVTDEYVRSVIDWLEVYKGVPSTLNGISMCLHGGSFRSMNWILGGESLCIVGQLWVTWMSLCCSSLMAVT